MVQYRLRVEFVGKTPSKPEIQEFLRVLAVWCRIHGLSAPSFKGQYYGDRATVVAFELSCTREQYENGLTGLMTRWMNDKGWPLILNPVEYT